MESDADGLQPCQAFLLAKDDDATMMIIINLLIHLRLINVSILIS